MERGLCYADMGLYPDDDRLIPPAVLQSPLEWVATHAAEGHLADRAAGELGEKARIRCAHSFSVLLRGQNGNVQESGHAQQELGPAKDSFRPLYDPQKRGLHVYDEQDRPRDFREHEGLWARRN